MKPPKETEEEIRDNIALLDARMEELHKEMKDVNHDSPEYAILMDECLEVMHATNHYLRMIHADVKEMYIF